jgi:hypothetical protein
LSDEAKVVRKIRTDPVWFCRNVLGFEPWSKQREILEALRDHDRVAVRSAHGIGKTAIAARAVLWFLLAHGPNSCRVVTTAPTWEGVRDLLWAEIKVAVRNARVPFGATPNVTDLRLAADWFAKGLSTDVPERFQGHHADHLLLVVDEASGVDEAIYDAARGFLTGQGAKVLLIGNPTRTVGTFRRAFDPDSGWRTIHVSAFDSPNLTGEDVPTKVARALPTDEWIGEMRRDYGDESATYAVRVLGEFAAAEGRPVFHDLTQVRPLEPIRIGRLVGEPFRGAKTKLAVIPAKDGPLKVWRAPKKGERFIVFADPAGVPKEDVYEDRDPRDGDDYCAAQVIDALTGEQVAELHGRWLGYEFAHHLARLGYIYNTALVAPEATGGYGNAVIEELRDRVGYPALYRRELLGKVAHRPVGTAVGWSTNVETREVMIDAIRRVVVEAPHLIKSDGLLGEMRTFVYDDLAKPGAAPGCHDDRVMAYAGALAVRMRGDSLVRLAPRPSVAKVAPLSRRAPRPKQLVA